jgi:hypothetical protein
LCGNSVIGILVLFGCQLCGNSVIGILVLFGCQLCGNSVIGSLVLFGCQLCGNSVIGSLVLSQENLCSFLNIILQVNIFPQFLKHFAVRIPIKVSTKTIMLRLVEQFKEMEFWGRETC